MRSPFVQLLLRWIVLALGVMLATKIVPGIHCQDGATLVVVVLLLSFFNAILKPLLVLFTLPFIIITLGLGVLIINALLFLLVGHLVEGFDVDSFSAAFWGALVLSATNWIVSAFTKSQKKASQSPAPRDKPKSDDVIDI